MPRIAAYLRKSKDAATKAEHLSSLLALVEKDGHRPHSAEVYDDWARSGGRAGLGKRSEWQRLCRGIESGEVRAVYLNDLDRGGRDLEEWLRFLRVAQDAGVKVVDRTGEWTTEARRTEFVFKAWLAEEEYRRAKERAQFTKRMQLARGDTFGRAPYGYQRARTAEGRIIFTPNPSEPLGPLLAAVREARGNISAACRALNEQGYRSKEGKPWQPRTLTRVIEREDPRLLPRRGHKGRKRSPSTHRLSRLVLCHCREVLLTPSRAHKALYCHVGHKATAAVHGKVVARERHIVSFLKDLTDRFIRIPLVSSGDVSEVREMRERIEARRKRYALLYGEGEITEPEYRAEVERARREIDELPSVDSALIGVGETEPLVDWDGPEERTNAQLRRLIRYVVMNEAMMPVGVEWADEAYRRHMEDQGPKLEAL